MLTHCEEAVCCTLHLLCRQQPIGFGFFGTSRTGREMSHEYIQCVPVHHQPADVKNIACRATALMGLIHRETLVRKQFEDTPLIEQCHIDAAFVGRLGHDIAIAGFPQGG